MFIGHLGCETEMPSRCGGKRRRVCQNEIMYEKTLPVVPSLGGDYKLTPCSILTHPRDNMFRECQGTRKRGGARWDSVLFVGVWFCSALFGFVRHCSSLFGQTRGSAPTRWKKLKDSELARLNIYN